MIQDAGGEATPTARARNRRGEGARLRDELVAAAGRVFERVGSEDAMSLRAVAAEAGVAAPSIYQHFPDKHALVQAVQAARFAELRAVIEAAAARAADPAEELRRRGRAYCRFGADHPGNYRVMFGSVPDTKGPLTLQELPGAEIIEDLVGSITRAAAAGIAGPHDAFTTAVLLWSALHGIVSLRIAKPAFPWPDTEALVDAALTALAGVPPGPAGDAIA
ncbi:MAG: WHG domain-containing protein [Thermoleophilia bacterium]|nr:WHG domain-containing protein [Thermoleophilia bacterium]